MALEETSFSVQQITLKYQIHSYCLFVFSCVYKRKRQSLAQEHSLQIFF